MKLNKNVLGIIAGCLVLLLLACGCQHKEEYIEQQTNQEQQEEVVDLELLEYEYVSMMTMVDHVFTTLSSSEDLTMSEVTSLLKYVTKNKVEPTQKLTIELDEMIDKGITKCINYYTAIDDERKKELEIELFELFQQLEEKCLEIELLLDTKQV